MEEQDNTNNNRKLFLIPFVLAGVFFLFYSVICIYNACKTVSWSRVEATLNEVRIEKDYIGDGSLNYLVRVDYGYVLNGKPYQSDRLAFGYGENNADRHLEIYDRLKKAKKVTAYVSPFNYNQAVLIRGMNNSILSVIVLTLMWNSITIVFVRALVFSIDEKNAHIEVAILLSIWLVGPWILVTQPINFLIEDKIEILEYEPSQEEEITPYF